MLSYTNHTNCRGIEPVSYCYCLFLYFAQLPIQNTQPECHVVIVEKLPVTIFICGEDYVVKNPSLRLHCIVVTIPIASSCRFEKKLYWR